MNDRVAPDNVEEWKLGYPHAAREIKRNSRYGQKQEIIEIDTDEAGADHSLAAAPMVNVISFAFWRAESRRQSSESRGACTIRRTAANRWLSCIRERFSLYREQIFMKESALRCHIMIHWRASCVV
jgi:hypothetical protein